MTILKGKDHKRAMFYVPGQLRAFLLSSLYWDRLLNKVCCVLLQVADGKGFGAPSYFALLGDFKIKLSLKNMCNADVNIGNKGT